MTAIKKYMRLEAPGRWQESLSSDPIEVLISCGKTSLIISDYQDNPLTHWSLTTIKLISHIRTDAIFSADFEGQEKLFISDAPMNDSLLLIINKNQARVSKKKILRYWLPIFSITLITAVIIYMPEKIRSLTESIISRDHEKQLLEPFVIDHIKNFGPVCNSPQSDQVLKFILESTNTENNTLSIEILRNQKMKALHLPGNTIFLSDSFINDLQNSIKLLRILENEASEAETRMPLKSLIQQQSSYSLVRLILGIDPSLNVKKASEFIVETKNLQNTIAKDLDDFSWVALQNACLN
jgi:hypothetical protein